MVWSYNHPNGDLNARPKYPDGFPDMISIKRYFAKTYGWTPSQVDELSIEEMEWFPIIEEAAMDAQDIIQDQQR